MMTRNGLVAAMCAGVVAGMLEPAATQTCPTLLSWTCSVVDATPGVGGFSAVHTPDGNAIFIAYHDATNQNLLVKQSTDSGLTWPTPPINIHSSPSTLIFEGRPVSILALDAQTVLVAFTDKPSTPGTKGKTWVYRSTDGGFNWLPVHSYDQTGRGTSLADANQSVWVAHHDTGAEVVGVAMSPTSGAAGTWTQLVGDPAVSPGVLQLSQGGTDPSIGALFDPLTGQSSKAYLCRTGIAPGAQESVVFNKTSDTGVSWTADFLIEQLTTNAEFSHSSLQVVDADQDLVAEVIYIAYYDEANGELRFTKSVDDGNTWLPQPMTVDSVGDVGSRACLVAVDAQQVLIVYEDTTNSSLTVALSCDGGTTWTTD